METPNEQQVVTPEVNSDARTAAPEVVNTPAPNVITITAEEKLAIRELENKFLKAQAEINRQQSAAQELQRNFPALIENLKAKYKVDPSDYIFDSNILEFRRK
jgi:hypothetical protein